MDFERTLVKEKGMDEEKDNFKVYYYEIPILNAALCELVRRMKDGQVGFHIDSEDDDDDLRNEVVKEVMAIRERLISLADIMTGNMGMPSISSDLRAEWEDE